MFGERGTVVPRVTGDASASVPWRPSHASAGMHKKGFPRSCNSEDTRRHRCERKAVQGGGGGGLWTQAAERSYESPTEVTVGGWYTSSGLS